MKKIVIETFGKIKDKSLLDLSSKYLDLCNHYIKTEMNVHKDVDNRKISAKDISLNSNCIILSERGKQLSSIGFSKFLTSVIDSQQEIRFVIGNAFGIEDDVIRQSKNLALSTMTFPHEITSVILLEQIYRALNIRSGGKYHK